MGNGLVAPYLVALLVFVSTMFMVSLLTASKLTALVFSILLLIYWLAPLDAFLGGTWENRAFGLLLLVTLFLILWAVRGLWEILDRADRNETRSYPEQQSPRSHVLQIIDAGIGAITFAGFSIAVLFYLSWYTVQFTYPFLLHFGLFLFGVAFLISMPLQTSPYTKGVALGLGGICALFSIVSWGYFPSLVIQTAGRLAADAPSCIYSREERTAITSRSQLTFLTVFKGHGSHFYLRTPTSQAEWSFRMRTFVPSPHHYQDIGLIEQAFSRDCVEAKALGA